MAKEKEESETGQTIAFHYVKNPTYRTIHVDGAYGSITPQGKIDLAFFFERFPIPTQTRHEVRADGKLGEETGRECREGVVREIESNVVMDVETATNIVRLLEDLIAKSEQTESRSVE